MKNDISKTIDLDSILQPQQEAMVEDIKPEQDEIGVLVDWDDVLVEWSYRCPKGYPTIVDGKFTDENELAILNELLVEMNYNVQEVASSTELSSNPTDVKEALVCLFVDALLVDASVETLYKSCLDKKADLANKASTINTLYSKLIRISNKYGKNYGITGYAKMPQYIKQCLEDLKTNKKDVIIINNGLGAALAVVNKFSNLQPGMVRRNEEFEAIRDHAVKLINTNYGIKNYYPDNWCPGDIYFFLDESKAKKVIRTTSLNVGSDSLNSYFYGTNNPNGSILAVSLKMQLAQAGKGTTFLKNVVVDGITPQDKLGKDVGTQTVIKFRDIKRRLSKYYLNNLEWKTNPETFEKVRVSITRLAKLANIPNVPLKPDQKEELTKWLEKNQPIVVKAMEQVDTKLNKTVDAVTVFQQAYTNFVKGLKDMHVEKVEGNSKDFLKSIEANLKKLGGGKINPAKLGEILAQKAATYDLASTLINKWTEKTKKLSPAFADYLNKIKNPFVAITLFAIAQHGLNPNFYKAVGTNNATRGVISEFPTNSQVDEKKSVQSLSVKDSPGQAGFYVNYNLTINNHTYRTTLTFRFSKDAIRVEVEELTQI